TGPHELLVEGEGGARPLRFEQLILAAGSRSVRLPGLPEDQRLLTSTTALELPEIPPRLLVVGGGIIGLEMACVYASLGARISIVELTESLVPGCDRDLLKPLEKRLKERFGVEFLLGTKVTGVEARSEALQVSFEGAQAPEGPQDYERVLLAVGRRPNSDQLGLEEAGLTAGPDGRIAVDTQMRTKV